MGCRKSNRLLRQPLFLYSSVLASKPVPSARRGVKSKNGKLNKAIPVFFIIAAFVIALLFVSRIFVGESSERLPRARIVTPVAPGETENQSSGDAVSSDNETMTSFVPLSLNETLIGTLSIDLDNDMKEDQIVAVRKEGIPYLVLIVGIYDAERNTYVRTAEITTEISRTRTFSYTGIDMLGEHQNALVYQGVKDDGTSVLAIYMMRRERNKIELAQIGDFESDGTIFIQQDDRSMSYELSQSRGESFPVWVYSSAKDPGGGENANLSQIQTEYRWNEKEQKYVETRQVRVTGSRIAARELARIQDGTVETFADFLDGLWYKTSSSQTGIRYLFFDHAQKEVIFLYDDTEEVYAWEDSNLRRSGIYITTTNKSITNMQRRCDISLAGIDEVRIHIIDDVRMIIKENNLWDGSYRKMTAFASFAPDSQHQNEYETAFTKWPEWKTDNGLVIKFEKTTYTVSGDGAYDEGIYVIGTVAGKYVVQFRSSLNSILLSSAYEMRFKTVTIPSSPHRSVEVQTDYHTLTLDPVRLAPDACYSAEGRTFTLTREAG